MEFEIINDILTSTVSKIFPNSIRHLNYFKLEEETVKSDIPKSSNRKEDQNAIQLSGSKGNSLYDQWKHEISKKRLEEAMKRLNIDEQRVKNKNLVNFGIDFLIAEKSKVKSELKKFDNEFFEMFQRYPNRNEKEVMRIVYMYYKNLKHAIVSKQGNTSGNISGTSSSNTSFSNKPGTTSTVNNNNIYTNNFTQNRKKDSVHTIDSNLSNNSNPFTNLNNASNGPNNSIYNFNNIYNQNDGQDGLIINVNKDRKSNASHSSNSSSVSSMSLASNPSIQANIANREKKYDNSSNKMGSNELKDNQNDLFDFNSDNKKTNKMSKYPKDKKYTKSELFQMEREYDSIKKEQVDLKQRLHNYQKEFFEIHHRRVKYYKDIIGVEEEYQKYKDNKNTMKDIQEILSMYKINKKN